MKEKAVVYVVHKGVNVGIFKIPKFENKLDVVISQINFISKDHDKCKFVLTFIQLVMIPIIFPLKAVQKMAMLPTLCITGKLD